jgi:hypothetical protein
MSTNVTIVNIESLNATCQQLGMQPLPPGTPLDKGVKQVWDALNTAMATKWAKVYPSVTAPAESDSGVMGPWSDNVPGTAPQCLTGKVGEDFKSWGLPVDDPAIEQMAVQITQEISSQGGAAGTFVGQSQVGGSETIYWAVGYGTGAIADGPPEMLGVIYTFMATLSVE